jgi:hypothetical protein
VLERSAGWGNPGSISCSCSPGRCHNRCHVEADVTPNGRDKAVVFRFQFLEFPPNLVVAEHDTHKILHPLRFLFL